ncbi:MAG TPA: CoA pyrophosphatase [Longimicrobiales bacterium]|nr:CoA pyrophosphatase [Longimicrobiales bacterium]
MLLSTMLDDPRIAQLRRAFESRPASAAPRTPGLREAAVALLVRPRSALEVLLIRRAELHGDPWSGHIALPGGRRSAADEDLLATACRETLEEVSVPVERVGTFLGALDEVAPTSLRLPPVVVAPFVLAVPPDTDAIPDPREVQAAFWVPIDALLDQAAASEILIEADDGPLRFPSLTWEDYVIWGLTYRILLQFLEAAS